jgi:hypothetical protein
MSDGAGDGPGLKGDGSQNAAEGTSTGDATPGSGSVAATGTGSAGGGDKNAGSVDKAPFVVAGLVVVLTLTGTLLL